MLLLIFAATAVSVAYLVWAYSYVGRWVAQALPAFTWDEAGPFVLPLWATVALLFAIAPVSAPVMAFTEWADLA